MSGSWFSEYFAKPVDGSEHTSLREELWIGGSDNVCRYYLSLLNNSDYFTRSLDELWRDVTEYVVRFASPDAIAFAHHSGPEICEFAVPFLKQQFDQTFGIQRKLTKEEQGMILLLKNPRWSDDRIRLSVKTTEKQMNRWNWYRRARAVQKWYDDSQAE